MKTDLMAEMGQRVVVKEGDKTLRLGGPLPLGYDVENRRLVVNPKEAELVRQI